jgi:hypothetical protein
MKQGMLLKPNSIFMRLLFILSPVSTLAVSNLNGIHNFNKENFKGYTNYTNIFVEEDDIEDVYDK